MLFGCLYYAAIFLLPQSVAQFNLQVYLRTRRLDLDLDLEPPFFFFLDSDGGAADADADVFLFWAAGAADADDADDATGAADDATGAADADLSCFKPFMKSPSQTAPLVHVNIVYAILIYNMIL